MNTEAQDIHENLVVATRALKAETETYRKIKREIDSTFNSLMSLWREILFLSVALFVVGVMLGFLVGVAL